MKRVYSSGFSLIELAIVLVVIGLFVGGAIGVYSRWVEKSQFEQAAEDIEIIKKAIIGYTVTHGYLPCSDIADTTDPTVEDGVEDRVGGVGSATACSSLTADEIRLLPYVTLGVKAFDPWGNVYRYRAAPVYSDGTTGNLFELNTTAAALVVNDGALAPTDIADQVAFVVYSLGPDEGRDFTIQQNENRDDNNKGGDDNLYSSTTYLPYNENGAGTADDTGFDDVISWVSTHVLKLYMVEAERLP